MPLYDYYVRLDDNHAVRVDEEGYQFVRCPFVNGETPWSPNAGPDEVDCVFCQIAREGEEALLSFPESHEGDGDPPIGGGEHGDTHSVYEYRPCRVPNRAFTWAGLTRPVHEGLIGELTDIRGDWEKFGGQGYYEIRSWWGYASRNCTGRSWHERGVALDINPAENPMVPKRTPCPSDMPKSFVTLFKSRGFGHGADWRSKCDAMHFSKGPPEGGDGILYKEVTAGEEDELTPEEKKRLEAVEKAVYVTRGGKRYEHINVLDNMLKAIGDKLGLKFNDDGTIRAGG